MHERFKYRLFFESVCLSVFMLTIGPLHKKGMKLKKIKIPLLCLIIFLFQQYSNIPFHIGHTHFVHNNKVLSNKLIFIFGTFLKISFP